jgi:hypothetical protein
VSVDGRARGVQRAAALIAAGTALGRDRTLLTFCGMCTFWMEVLLYGRSAETGQSVGVTRAGMLLKGMKVMVNLCAGTSLFCKCRCLFGAQRWQIQVGDSLVGCGFRHDGRPCRVATPGPGKPEINKVGLQLLTSRYSCSVNALISLGHKPHASTLGTSLLGHVARQSNDLIQVDALLPSANHSFAGVLIDINAIFRSEERPQGRTSVMHSANAVSLGSSQCDHGGPYFSGLIGAVVHLVTVDYHFRAASVQLPGMPSS